MMTLKVEKTEIFFNTLVLLISLKKGEVVTNPVITNR